MSPPRHFPDLPPDPRLPTFPADRGSAPATRTERAPDGRILSFLRFLRTAFAVLAEIDELRNRRKRLRSERTRAKVVTRRVGARRSR